MSDKDTGFDVDSIVAIAIDDWLTNNCAHGDTLKITKTKTHIFLENSRTRQVYVAVEFPEPKSREEMN